MKGAGRIGPPQLAVYRTQDILNTKQVLEVTPRRSLQRSSQKHCFEIYSTVNS